jgi:hypothetical protein
MKKIDTIEARRQTERERHRAHYQKHKIRIRQRQKEYDQKRRSTMTPEDKERIRQQRAKYYQENKERISARQKERRRRIQLELPPLECKRKQDALTDDQLIERLQGCDTLSSAAARTGRSKKAVERLYNRLIKNGHKLTMPPDKPTNGAHNKAAYMPTQDEISAICERIRASWSDEVRNSRLRADWRNPVVGV